MTEQEAILWVENNFYGDLSEDEMKQNLKAMVRRIFKGYDFIEQYKFSDKCPDYKTKEQFEIFISARKEDIKNISNAICEAELKVKEYK